MFSYSSAAPSSAVCAVALLMLLSTGKAIWAQQVPASRVPQTLEEIVVTATKIGETDLHTTPIAITSVSSDELADAGVSDLRSLTAVAPNIQVAENAHFTQLYMRGIGSNNVYVTNDPSSTIHLDGVYIARPPAAFFSFLDVERIEVLRGPQGTLYGRNSMGGTINVVSRRPDSEAQAKGKFSFGNEGTYQAEAYVNGALGENLSGSLSGLYSGNDDYWSNVIPGNTGIGKDETWALRGQLLFEIGGQTEVLFKADVLEREGNTVGFSKLVEPLSFSTGMSGLIDDTILDSPDRIAHDVAEQPAELDNWGVSIDINTDLTERVSLKSLTSWRENDIFLRCDCDASSIGIVITNLTERQEQISQEFNLLIKDERYSAVLGAYYFHEKGRSPWRVEIPVIALDQLIDANIKTENWALFGQVNYEFSDRFSGTLGLRYTYEKKDFDQVDIGFYLPGTDVLVTPLGEHNYQLDDSYNSLLPKFGLEYMLSDNVFLYGSVTKGFKSGGFDLFGQVSDTAAYDPESVWAYEVGAKLELPSQRLRLNLAAFYYDLSDLQVQIFVGPAVTEIANAADAEVKGVEMEFRFYPSDNLELTGALTWLDAQYTSFEADPVSGPFLKDLDIPSPFGGRLFQSATLGGSYTGNTLNSSPEWTFNLAGKYTLNLADMGSAYVWLGYVWQDDVFFRIDNDPRLRQDAYGLLNARTGYVSANENWEIALWGRNLTDEEYYRALGEFTAGIAGRPGVPVTYGVEFSLAF